MKATDLKPGDRIEFNYGAMFPTVDMIVIGIDSNSYGAFFAIAVDEDGNETRFDNPSADESANGSPIGWRLTERAAA